MYHMKGEKGLSGTVTSGMFTNSHGPPPLRGQESGRVLDRVVDRVGKRDQSELHAGAGRPSAGLRISVHSASD
jgi:hypothetical protein